MRPNSVTGKMKMGRLQGQMVKSLRVNEDTGALEKDGVQVSSGGEMATTRGKLGTVADAAMDVAADAGDQNYYTKLKNLLYADATDQIDRSSRSARDFFAGDVRQRWNGHLFTSLYVCNDGLGEI
jgi:hypothetical protein